MLPLLLVQIQQVNTEASRLVVSVGEEPVALLVRPLEVEVGLEPARIAHQVAGDKMHEVVAMDGAGGDHPDLPRDDVHQLVHLPVPRHPAPPARAPRRPRLHHLQRLHARRRRRAALNPHLVHRLQWLAQEDDRCRRWLRC
jgi:hypothetical protein